MNRTDFLKKLLAAPLAVGSALCAAKADTEYGRMAVRAVKAAAEREHLVLYKP